jgi:hypothetical protein
MRTHTAANTHRHAHAPPCVHAMCTHRLAPTSHICTHTAAPRAPPPPLPHPHPHPHPRVCVRWSRSYKPFVAPSKWTGSLPIFHAWLNGGPVKWGQCFTFAATLTTVMRLLGVPCRPVSNYWSAHDTGYDRVIDKFFDADGKKLGHDTHDSIWTFHVWNDVRRPRATAMRPPARMPTHRRSSSALLTDRARSAAVAVVRCGCAVRIWASTTAGKPSTRRRRSSQTGCGSAAQRQSWPSSRATASRHTTRSSSSAR